MTLWLRRFSFLFIIIACNYAQAQESTSLKLDYSAKGKSLTRVFDDLEKSYNIRFSYATESIEDINVDIDFDQASIDDIMSYLLGEQPLEYIQLDDNILIRKKEDYITADTPTYRQSIHLRGRVTETQSKGNSLSYATISVSNSHIGTYTDDEGYFDFEISPDYLDRDIVIHALGYEDMIYKIRDIGNEFLAVAMNQGSIDIEEITIVNRDIPIRIVSFDNQLTLTSTQLDNYTSGLVGRDISRQLQLLPGVAAFDDASADIKIRGSNSDETLMIIDGMPVYNASHYYNIFSSFNADYIDEVNMYKNVFPLHYGGKTAGIVQLSSDQEQPDNLSIAGELNLMTGSITLRQPINANSFFSIAARSTLRGVSNSQFNTVNSETNFENEVETFSQDIDNIKSSPNFNFNDVHAKFQTNIGSKSVLSANFYRSHDDYNNNYLIDLKDRNQDRVDLEARERADWNTTASSLLFSSELSDNLQLSSTLFYSSYVNDESIDFNLNKRIGGSIPLPKDLNSEQYNAIDDTGFDTHLSLTHNRSAFKFGVASVRHDMDFRIKENNQNNLSDKDVNYEHSLYGGYVYGGDMFNISTGVRMTHYTRKEGLFFSPRILINIKASDKLLFKGGYSYYQQAIRKLDYQYRSQTKEIWVHSGRNLVPVLRSQNQMLGMTARILKATLDVELFYKDIDGLVEYAVPIPGDNRNDPNKPGEYEFFDGDGRSYGLDVLLSYGHKSYDTYVSYTWSRTEERFKEIARKRYYPSENDRRHQLKWINILDAKPFIIGLDMIYASGRNYNDLRSLGNNGDIRDINPEDRLKFLPAYQRLDISLGYEFKLGKLDSGIFFSVFNLTNNQNVKYVQSVITDVQENQMQTVNTVIGSDAQLLNRTFNLSWRVEL